MTKKEMMNKLSEMNVKFNKKATVSELTALLNAQNERLPETVEKHTAESTFAEKYEVAETIESEAPETIESDAETVEIVKADPRADIQNVIDVELAKRADFIRCKYTPGMKRTTVLNRDNNVGMFYCEVQKKTVTFHSKHDMLPEVFESVARVVIGNKVNPYAVKVAYADVPRTLALYLARVERVRVARKAQ